MKIQNSINIYLAENIGTYIRVNGLVIIPEHNNIYIAIIM